MWWAIYILIWLLFSASFLSPWGKSPLGRVGLPIEGYVMGIIILLLMYLIAFFILYLIYAGIVKAAELVKNPVLSLAISTALLAGLVALVFKLFGIGPGSTISLVIVLGALPIVASIPLAPALIASPISGYIAIQCIDILNRWAATGVFVDMRDGHTYRDFHPTFWVAVAAAWIYAIMAPIAAYKMYLTEVSTTERITEEIEEVLSKPSLTPSGGDEGVLEEQPPVETPWLRPVSVQYIRSDNNVYWRIVGEMLEILSRDYNVPTPRFEVVRGESIGDVCCAQGDEKCKDDVKGCTRYDGGTIYISDSHIALELILHEFAHYYKHYLGGRTHISREIMEREAEEFVQENVERYSDVWSEIVKRYTVGDEEGERLKILEKAVRSLVKKVAREFKTTPPRIEILGDGEFTRRFGSGEQCSYLSSAVIYLRYDPWCITLDTTLYTFYYYLKQQRGEEPREEEAFQFMLSNRKRYWKLWEDASRIMIDAGVKPLIIICKNPECSYRLKYGRGYEFTYTAIPEKPGILTCPICGSQELTPIPINPRKDSNALDR